MKRIAFLVVPVLVTFLLSGNTISQQKTDGDRCLTAADTSVVYSYDAAGNRIKRTISVTSSKTISLQPDSVKTVSDTLNLKIQ